MGCCVGILVGESVGCSVGKFVGLGVGAKVGEWVGGFVAHATSTDVSYVELSSPTL